MSREMKKLSDVGCRYGSGFPEGTSRDGPASRTLEAPLPFCAKKIAIVISSIAMAAQNRTSESCLPYRAESFGSLRTGGAVSEDRMRHLPN
jgi:hypothetical protein